MTAVIEEADDRVGAVEAEGDEHGACDDAEGDEPVRAGVVAVGRERGAVETPRTAQPHLSGDLVADEADQAGRRENPEVGERLRVDQPLDRLVESDAGRHEDREDDEQPRDLLGAKRAQVEGDPEGDRSERVTEVVDQVGEERDRAGLDEDQRLRECRHGEHGEADEHRPDAFARARDRTIDQAM